MKSLLALSFIAFGLSFASKASAETIEACIDAHARAQDLQVQSKLLEAIHSFQQCSSEACPDAIRSECTSSILAAKAAVPSIVIAVRRGDQDVLDAKVWLDSSPDPLVLDGRPIELDPGPHRIKVQHQSDKPIELELVLRQAEKARLVSIELPKPARVAALPPPTPPSVAKPPSRTAAWVMTGLAVAGGASFGTFAVLGQQKEKELRTCKPNCEKDDVRDMRRKYLIADASLGFSVLSLATATWLFWPSSPSEAGNHRKVAANVGVAPDGGFAVSASMRFW